MSNSLRDKVVVVTGASSGIGRSIALESASRGATVILMARHQDKLEEIANEARQLSGNEVYVFPTDISKADQIDRAFNEIVSHVDHIDYLVNAAGFGVFKEFLETIVKRSIHKFNINVSPSDRILTLSTCKNDFGKRIVVHAKLLKEETN